MLCEVIVNTSDYNMRDLDGKHKSTLRNIIKQKNKEDFPEPGNITESDIDDFVIGWFNALAKPAPRRRRSGAKKGQHAKEQLPQL